MRALKDDGFNPTALVQTIEGTKQALRCAASTVHELANNGELDRAGPGRITTKSIQRLIRRRVKASRKKQKETAAAAQKEAAA
jgi:hypothetical protein